MRRLARAAVCALALAGAVSARSLIVDQSGSNGAHTTIQGAIDVSAPGDTITVNDGTYTEEPFLTTSGTANAWIVLRAAHKWQAMIRGQKGYGYLVSVHASFVIIDGFDISDSSSGTGGIEPYNVQHVTMRNLRVHRCGANGISAYGCDGIIIEDCLACENAWKCPGTSNSGISTIALQKMYDKASGEYGLIVRRNQLWDNEDKDGGTDVGGTITDGNGIIVDISDAYQEGILVENNLSINNGGKGILVLHNSNVMVRNNTCWNNAKTANLNGDKAEIEVSNSSNCTVINNICYARTGNYSIATAGSTNTVCQYNVYFNGILKNFTATGNHLVNADPLFVNAADFNTSGAGADFSLKSGSPAINAGSATWGLATTDILGNPRVSGGTVDIGAYEYGSVTGVRPAVASTGDNLRVRAGVELRVGAGEVNSTFRTGIGYGSLFAMDGRRTQDAGLRGSRLAAGCYLTAQISSKPSIPAPQIDR